MALLRRMTMTRLSSLLLPCLLSVWSLCCPPSLAQNSVADYVNAHNNARAAVGLAPMVWNTTLQKYAQGYASKRAASCELVHSNGPYGENLAAGYDDFSGAGAVKLWVDEKADYHHASNSCNSGAVCGHYTQVVWRNSVRLGCARVRCSGGTYEWFIICSYDPPGNYIGEKPY